MTNVKHHGPTYNTMKTLYYDQTSCVTLLCKFDNFSRQHRPFQIKLALDTNCNEYGHDCDIIVKNITICIENASYSQSSGEQSWDVPSFKTAK